MSLWGFRNTHHTLYTQWTLIEHIHSPLCHSYLPFFSVPLFPTVLLPITWPMNPSIIIHHVDLLPGLHNTFAHHHTGQEMRSKQSFLR